MSRVKVVGLGFLGLFVPVALALTAYTISRSTIGSAGTVPSLTHAPAQMVSPTESPGPGEDGKHGSGGATTPGPQVTVTATDDHGGRCSEPEHSSDPTCGESGGGDESSSHSGKGRGGGDD